MKYGIDYKKYTTKNEKIAAILSHILKNKYKPKKKLRVLNEIIENKTNVINMSNILLSNKNKYRVIVTNNVDTWIKTKDLSKLLGENSSIFFKIITKYFPNGKIEQNTDLSQTFFRLSIPFNAIITIDDVYKLFANMEKFAAFELIKTNEIVGELISADRLYGGTAVGAFHGHTPLYKLKKIPFR
tara:strand:- start:1630 stop:2184 length:555 start_codon:yes stop_codon:yes gene_type:complete